MHNTRKASDNKTQEGLDIYLVSFLYQYFLYIKTNSNHLFLTKRSIIVQIYEINQIFCKKNKKIPFWRLFCLFLLSFGVLYILYKQLEIKS